MKFTTYILYSESIKKFYSGSTEDFEQRFREHNEGRSKYTSSGRSWKLVWRKEFDSRSDAMPEEQKIKARGAGRYLADLTSIGV